MTLLLDPPARVDDAPSAAHSASAATWGAVCRTSDLEPYWGEAVIVAGRRLALFYLGGEEVYATELADPRHGSEVMARGIVGSRGDRLTIASPLHKEVYDLETGECFSDPSLSLATFRARIVGDEIQVRIAA